MTFYEGKVFSSMRKSVIPESASEESFLKLDLNKDSKIFFCPDFEKDSLKKQFPQNSECFLNMTVDFSAKSVSSEKKRSDCLDYN